MPQFEWRVYLADGSTFDSTQGGPDDVPRSPRVVCIAQPCGKEAFRTVLTNGDWYVWRDDLGCWMEHSDQAIALEFVDHAPVIGAVRAGKYTSRPVFESLWERARADAKAAGRVV